MGVRNCNWHTQRFTSGDIDQPLWGTWTEECPEDQSKCHGQPCLRDGPPFKATSAKAVRQRTQLRGNTLARYGKWHVPGTANGTYLLVEWQDT